MQESWIAFEGLGIKFKNVSRGFEFPNYLCGILIAVGIMFALIMVIDLCKQYNLLKGNTWLYIVIGAIPVTAIGTWACVMLFKLNEVSGVQIYWYGILIALGFMLAVIAAFRVCNRHGFSQDDILTYIICCTPVAIVCARLYFVAFKWSDYSSNLWLIFDVRSGGLAIYGAVIGIAISAFIMAKVKKQSLIELFDFALPYVLIGQAVGRWGNFVNQEAYGITTDLPWGMSGSGIVEGKVHPNFLYESLWCIFVFVLIILYRNKFRKNKGEVMSLYFIGYGIGRAFIESIRGEDTLMFLGQRVSMWLSILLVVGFGAYFVHLRFMKGYNIKGSDMKEETDISDMMESDIGDAEKPIEEIRQERVEEKCLFESSEEVTKEIKPEGNGDDR